MALKTLAVLLPRGDDVHEMFQRFVDDVVAFLALPPDGTTLAISEDIDRGARRCMNAVHRKTLLCTERELRAGLFTLHRAYLGVLLQLKGQVRMTTQPTKDTMQ